MRMLQIPLVFLSMLLVMAPLGVRAGLIGDDIHGELQTVAAGSFPTTNAVVGSGVEFSRVFTFPQYGGDTVEFDLDVADNSFTVTYVNNLSESCPEHNPGCLFNMGLLGIELSDLDWSEGPGTQIFGVDLVSSTFAANAITGTSFGLDTIQVDFAQPIIPGFGTVWTATWDIRISNVPEPGAIALFAAGLIGLGFSHKRNNTQA